MRYTTILFLSCFLFITSCDNPEKENQLNQRESELLTREQELVAKQQEFAKLEALRDSIENLTDSANFTKIPDAIIGKYNGKMICTESDCSENVLGDQRNDIWEISADGVKITNKTGGEKFYNGEYSNMEIKLKSDQNASSSQITLQMPEPLATRIKGIRELKRENCISKFSIDLEKIKN